MTFAIYFFILKQHPSLRKQPTFGDATTGFPAKRRLRNERRNSVLMTRHCPDLGNASDWLNQISHLARPIRSTTQIWEVTSHQYGITALFSQTSFGGETSGSVAKCRLFSRPNNTQTMNTTDWQPLKPLKNSELVEWNVAGTGFRSKSSWWISINKLIDSNIDKNWRFSSLTCSVNLYKWPNNCSKRKQLLNIAANTLASRVSGLKRKKLLETPKLNYKSYYTAYVM